MRPFLRGCPSDREKSPLAYTRLQGIPAKMTQLHRQLRGAMRFDDVKSDTLNLRVSPSFKLALKAAADHEQRSMVNMLEVLVASFCKAKGIPIPRHRAGRARAESRPHVKAAA